MKGPVLAVAWIDKKPVFVAGTYTTAPPSQLPEIKRKQTNGRILKVSSKVVKIEARKIMHKEVFSTAIEASGSIAGILQPDSDIQKEETSKLAEENQAKILQKLEAAFQQLTSPDDLDAYLALHSRMRVMVLIEKLLSLWLRNVQSVGRVFTLIKMCEDLWIQGGDHPPVHKQLLSKVGVI
ncbi:hypothetical protein ACROYT_G015403 [Oculina patagonica]